MPQPKPTGVVIDLDQSRQLIDFIEACELAAMEMRYQFRLPTGSVVVVVPPRNETLAPILASARTVLRMRHVELDLQLWQGEPDAE